MASTLGNRLRVARAERELSQEQLARLVGVTRQTISATIASQTTSHSSSSAKSRPNADSPRDHELPSVAVPSAAPPAGAW